jgi:hypothetical protein
LAGGIFDGGSNWFRIVLIEIEGGVQFEFRVVPIMVNQGDFN